MDMDMCCSLAGNGLVRVPTTFQQSFPLLTRLDLSSNRLTVVPTSLLRNTPRLEQLNLDNNQLVSLILEVGIAKTVEISSAAE